MSDGAFVGKELLDRLEDAIVEYDAGGDDLRKARKGREG